MWRCGDTYQYPIPKANDDSWEVVFEAMMKHDRDRCNGWKDEVQNLLIFVRFALLARHPVQIQIIPGWFVFCSCHSIRCGISEITTS